MQGEEYKYCAQCDQTKPIAEFARDRNRRDGYYCYCKLCNRRRAREHHWRGREMPKKPVRPDVESIDPAFGNWLAGFIDGEGCFRIERIASPNAVGYIYACGLSLVLRDDDAAILHEIKAVTQIGAVILRPSYNYGDRNANPQAGWHVRRKADSVALVDILDRYPLRAKKAKDYAIWRDAVMLWKDVTQGGAVRYDPGCNDAIWPQIQALRDRLKEVRAYHSRQPE
jgi:LAGLIDADG DNA endonuclease family protein